jgi:hypothetical protein
MGLRIVLKRSCLLGGFVALMLAASFSVAWRTDAPQPALKGPPRAPRLRLAQPKTQWTRPPQPSRTRTNKPNGPPTREPRTRTVSPSGSPHPSRGDPTQTNPAPGRPQQ